MFSIKLFGWSSVCFISIETLKLSVSVKKRNNRNKLFKTNQNKPKKKNETTLNFMKKFQNMVSTTLFRLFSCLFRFNQNTETLCFGREPKQPKQTFCFG
jgi:hypothetical protein